MAFIACYHGPCADCDSDVRGAEVVHNGNDQVVHVVCPDPTAAKGAICPACFTEIPVSGVCGVCE